MSATCLSGTDCDISTLVLLTVYHSPISREMGEFMVAKFLDIGKKNTSCAISEAFKKVSLQGVGVTY